jgi:hypothetical protein
MAGIRAEQPEAPDELSFSPFLPLSAQITFCKGSSRLRIAGSNIKLYAANAHLRKGKILSSSICIFC